MVITPLKWPIVSRKSTATYDALGRMASWAEAGNATTPAADQAWSYDAVGNVRRRTGHSNWLNVFGAPVYGSPLTSNSAIYQYDAMNRMTGGNGVAVTYNAAGQRMTATGYATLTVTIANPTYDPELPNKPGNRPTMTIDITVATLEHYAYDAAGNLATVRIAQGTWSDNYDGTVTTYAPTGAGALKSTFGYDGMGRQVRQQDWTGDGSGVAYDRQVTYDAKGRVSYETDVQKQGNDTYTSYVSNAFADGGGTAYALGAVTSSTNASYKNGAYQSTASTATSYGWYDAAVQSQVDYSPGTGGTYHTWYTNSATGVLQSASVNDGRPRSISLTNDALGQALRRDEADNTASTGDPHELWYRFNGKQIGYIGNNDTDNIGYAASLQRRVTANVAGPFKNGQTYGAGIVDFDQAYDAINSYSQGAGGGSYTVRDGDSLSGIAAQLWGDAGLWYKLAQANGLSGDTGLAAGQTLSVPAGVVRSSNNASTFRPYDVSQAYGDSSPTTPSPTAARKNKCGAFGAILLVAIAVAVTVVTAGAAAAALSPAISSIGAGIGALASGSLGLGVTVAAGAIGGALGSIVSQGVGVATGIQGKFDWKGVALGALSGAVGGGIAKLGLFADLGKIGSGAFNGALGSTVTQGIGVTTGLQSKFDWAGVAAAGIGGGVGVWAGGKLGAASLTDRSFSNIAANLGAGAAGGIANAAARSLINGTDFGDNLMAALPDVIGQTIGSLVAGSVDRSKQIVAADRARLIGTFAPDGKPTDKLLSGIEDYQRFKINAQINPNAETRGAAGQAFQRLLDVASESPAGRAVVDDFYDQLAESEGSNSNVVVSGGEEAEITVNGFRRYLILSPVDRGAIYLGKSESAIKGKIAEVIKDHPGVGIALEAADLTMKAVGGPVRYVAGVVVDNLKDTATNYISGQMQDAGWDQEHGNYGGSGAVFGISILATGFGAIKGTMAIVGATKSASRGGAAVLGSASEIRTVNIRPSRPGWGLTPKHLDKHLFGNSKYSMKTIDPGGTADIWRNDLTELYNSPVTGKTSNGMLDIVREFPRADGRGTYKMGIRISPRKPDGSHDLITILTRQ